MSVIRLVRAVPPSGVSLGKPPAHQDMFRTSAELCDQELADSSLYKLLHRECHRLFPDEAFADLFQDIGRRSVAPRIVAVVMVLQRFEGLSDREAVERFTFDLGWKYAAGGLTFDVPGFVHTVLVDMRARLRGSARANRSFEAVLEVAKAAGLVGRKRVLDSTALYDAVATQDTVTMTRSGNYVEEARGRAGPRQTAETWRFNPFGALAPSAVDTAVQQTLEPPTTNEQHC